MTLQEAHDWLDNVGPGDFSIEWLGGRWVAYQWFGPAAGPDFEFKGSFIEAVEHLQSIAARRAADIPSQP